MEKRYPDGMKDFRDLVSGGYYFVDKTMMIAEVCSAKDQTFLYTRPRRFGKSINLSMLDYYFNVKYKDDSDIFKGLRIDNCEQCKPYKNAYPVIRMNFGDLRCESVSAFKMSLQSLMSSVAREAKKILKGKEFDSDDYELISCASSKSLNDIDVPMFIKQLCRIYYDVFSMKTIILVDEYDHCIQNIHSPERFEEIIEQLRPFMEQTFKFNECIQFGVVTGIMPLAKTSMLSSFNNAVVCSTLEAQGDELFGFTTEDVIQLLRDTNTPPQKIDEIREWYDGYHFGNVDVYNPYSVIMYLKNKCSPEGYWNGMTGGGISKDLLSNMGSRSLMSLRNLYEHPESMMESPIDNRISYSDMISPAVNPYEVYSYLAMAGYLKTIRTGKMIDVMPVCKIGMVNREVSEAFISLVKKADEVETRVREAMDAVYQTDAPLLKADLESVLSGIAMDESWRLKENPSLRHNRYRDVIMAYLMTPDMVSAEEIPKGYGNTDIFFPASGGKPPVVMEIKTTVDERKNLIALAEEGLDQIRIKRYADEPGMRDAILVGVGIWMKTVEVVFGTVPVRRTSCDRSDDRSEGDRLSGLPISSRSNTSCSTT
ncbi:MAG: AAA family ATPase [Candidatus Methanomethylophilaceae archaeon]|nr:AAA family ATPase [Candidatus Methanomethylophilaceae archaeon]